MDFQSENSIFRFYRRSVDGAWETNLAIPDNISEWVKAGVNMIWIGVKFEIGNC